MRLYFTRHGESEANSLRIISNRDLPYNLTEKGHSQATALAKKLMGKPIGCIYSSPIPRAKQTAEILSSILGKPMECVDALREPDCGVLEGRGDEDAWRQHDHFKASWAHGLELSSGPEGGETCEQARMRLAFFVGNLIDQYGKTELEFVLVTHGALILYGLPVIVAGWDDQDVLLREIGHTGLITTEWRDQMLTLVEWGA
jgi:broad specificity phosphatase PhoE